MSGLPIRPTTGRERARKYQRQANDLLEEQLYALQNLAPQQQILQPTPIPNDTRPRGTCPACLEMMLVGASTCPYCQTTGIIWPETSQQRAEAELRAQEAQLRDQMHREARKELEARAVSELKQDQSRRHQVNITKRENEKRAASAELGVDAIQCPFCAVFIPTTSTSCPHCENNL